MTGLCSYYVAFVHIIINEHFVLAFGAEFLVQEVMVRK